MYGVGNGTEFLQLTVFQRRGLLMGPQPDPAGAVLGDGAQCSLEATN